MRDCTPSEVPVFGLEGTIGLAAVGYSVMACLVQGRLGLGVVLYNRGFVWYFRV